MDTDGNIEALFDDDGDDELLAELLEENEQEIAKESKPKAPGDDDLDLLNNFFEDEEEDETPVNKDDLNKMEDEYKELEKKMKLLKQKMNTSADEKCENVPVNNKEPQQENLPQTEQKRSFFDAFGGGVADESSVQAENSVVPNEKSKPEKNTKSEPEPSQKRRRVCHDPTSQVTSPTSSSKTALSSFYQNSKQTSKQKPAPSQPKPFKGQQFFETEHFSRLRLKERFVSQDEMKERMKSKLFVKIGVIRPTQKLCEEKDWVTVAVVAKQLDPQTAKNGKQFSIWHLTDLDDCNKHVALFLFGIVHEELWKKITVGSVIGILNPSIMPPRKDNVQSQSKNYDNTPALTVDVSERIMRIGISADLGWCMATKFRNKKPAGKCLAFINKNIGETCIFHMQSKYKKMGAKRGELQGSVGAPIADKYKKTMWNKVKGDQFFYGGQTYSAAPPSTNHTIQRKESKMTLTKMFGKVSNENQKEAIEKSKIMQAISGIKEEQAISGCSNTFEAMLTSGDNIAGSRQFLNHLQRKQKEKIEKEVEKPKPPSSAAAFLRQQKNEIQEKKKANVVRSTKFLKIFLYYEMIMEKILSSNSFKPFYLLQNQVKPNSSSATCEKQPTKQYVTAAQIKKCTEELIKAKRQAALHRKQAKLNSQGEVVKPLSVAFSAQTQALVGSSAPKLGGGLNKQVELSEGWESPQSFSNKSPTLAELRKRKAIAKLKSENGTVSIPPSRPNKISPKRGKNDEKQLEKLKEKVKRNREKQGEKNKLSENGKENLTSGSENNSSLMEVMGSGEMCKEDFDKILKARSSHTTELDIAEMEKQEKYFNPLIQKEMLMEKMADTYEVASKIVTCEQCSYTFWAPHERCKAQQHSLTWQSCKKKFFECTKCKQRTTTWEPYPTTSCRGCGNQKTWSRTSMLRSKNGVKLDSEILLVRGVEQPKFFNSAA
ncbi:protein MCM10 homolog [Ciona intestinalis]